MPANRENLSVPILIRPPARTPIFSPKQRPTRGSAADQGVRPTELPRLRRAGRCHCHTVAGVITACSAALRSSSPGAGCRFDREPESRAMTAVASEFSRCTAYGVFFATRTGLASNSSSLTIAATSGDLAIKQRNWRNARKAHDAVRHLLPRLTPTNEELQFIIERLSAMRSRLQALAQSRITRDRRSRTATSAPKSQSTFLIRVPACSYVAIPLFRR